MADPSFAPRGKICKICTYCLISGDKFMILLPNFALFLTILNLEEIM